MFYRNLNLSYLNLQIATDSKVRSYDDFLIFFNNELINF